MATPFKVRDKSVELINGMLFAKPLESDSTISMVTTAESEESPAGHWEKIHQAVILATQDKINVVFSGAWLIEMLIMSQATTLFSFLDYQGKAQSIVSGANDHEHNCAVLTHTDRNLIVILENESRSTLGLLVATKLNPQDRRLESLFSFIRGLESYWVAHFLLSQLMNEDNEGDNHKIGAFSKAYGVSESYFRKLCHHAFTRGPKKQMRLWRAAHSVLQLIEKDNSIAVIAGNNGYASSSHFSSEIKSLFGITPREFKKLEGFLHD